MTRAKPRLVLVDDHPLLVEGLKGMLKRRFDVVGVAHSGVELLKLLEHQGADCVLLDLAMPDRNGIELIPDIRALHPDLRILIVTMHLDRVLADTVMHAGANGFIPKDSGLEELEEAIDAVLDGKRYVSPRVPAITWSAGLGADNPVLATLTPRQRDILKMIADGRSSAEMATTLGVSQPTVTFHRANLRRKLGVHTEWGLVRFAILMQVRENEKNGGS